MDLSTMDLAVRTVASTGAIWLIVIVMSIMTAILVSAPIVADSVQARSNRRARRLAALGFGGVADGPAAAGREPVPAQRAGEAVADAPTRPDLPAVPGMGTPQGQALPEQRSGASDSAARSPSGGSERRGR